MSSGKSTLGKEVAKALGYRFLDLDEYIEGRAQKSVSEIFASLGEDAFRKMETQALEAIDQEFTGNYIIACGGGTPCYHDNLGRLNKMGLTVYLRQTVPVLVSRLKKEQLSRPLVRNIDTGGLEPFVTELLGKRESFYLQAQEVLEGEQLSPAGLVRAILKHS